MNKRDFVLSKALSWLLRHHVDDKGLNMDSEGYVPLNDVLSLTEFDGYTIVDVKRVVDNNDKKRFSLTEKDNILYIRANQGHSKHIGNNISDNKALKPINVNEQKYAYHGTTYKAWEAIKKTGLSSMGRKHVHMSKNTNTNSGLRSNMDVILEIDLINATANGITFYESDNGVILTKDIISPIFIKRII